MNADLRTRVAALLSLASCVALPACQSSAAGLSRPGFEVPATGRVLDLTRALDADSSGATRLLAPAALGEDGTTVDQISAGRLVGPLVVLDLREASLMDPAAVLDVEEVELQEAEHGEIPPGAIVFLRTGQGDTDPDQAGAGFSPAAVEYLVRQRGVVGLGIDGPSLGAVGDDIQEARRQLLAEDRYGVVHLAGLDRVPLRGSLGFVAPARRSGATEAPARVVAVVPRTVATR